MRKRERERTEIGLDEALGVLLVVEDGRHGGGKPYLGFKKAEEEGDEDESSSSSSSSSSWLGFWFSLSSPSSSSREGEEASHLFEECGVSSGEEERGRGEPRFIQRERGSGTRGIWLYK